jgi:hypothetical protein
LVSFRDDVIEQHKERDKLMDEKYDRLQKIVGFFGTAPDVFGPYMKLSQKNTPFLRPW